MEGRKINMASSVKSIVKSIISGDILLRLRVDKLFPYILYAFALGWISIFMSYKMEQTLGVVEKNRTELETLKIHHAQKTCEYVCIYSCSVFIYSLRILQIQSVTLNVLNITSKSHESVPIAIIVIYAVFATVIKLLNDT